MTKAGYLGYLMGMRKRANATAAQDAYIRGAYAANLARGGVRPSKLMSDDSTLAQFADKYHSLGGSDFKKPWRETRWHGKIPHPFSHRGGEEFKYGADVKNDTFKYSLQPLVDMYAEHNQSKKLPTNPLGIMLRNIFKQ